MCVSRQPRLHSILTYLLPAAGQSSGAASSRHPRSALHHMSAALHKSSRARWPRTTRIRRRRPSSTSRAVHATRTPQTRSPSSTSRAMHSSRDQIPSRRFPLQASCTGSHTRAAGLYAPWPARLLPRGPCARPRTAKSIETWTIHHQRHARSRRSGNLSSTWRQRGDSRTSQATCSFSASSRCGSPHARMS